MECGKLQADPCFGEAGGGPTRGQAGGRNWLGTGLMWLLKDLEVLLRGGGFLLTPWCPPVGAEHMSICAQVCCLCHF